MITTKEDAINHLETQLQGPGMCRCLACYQNTKHEYLVVHAHDARGNQPGWFVYAICIWCEDDPQAFKRAAAMAETMMRAKREDGE